MTEGTGYGDDGGEVSEEEEPELIASQIVKTRESTIVTARAKAVVGQDKQAAKMLQRNKKAINSFKVGDLVLLATEGVDRGASDAPNILCFILAKRVNRHFMKS